MLVAIEAIATNLWTFFSFERHFSCMHPVLKPRVPFQPNFLSSKQTCLVQSCWIEVELRCFDSAEWSAGDHYSFRSGLPNAFMLQSQATIVRNLFNTAHKDKRDCQELIAISEKESDKIAKAYHAAAIMISSKYIINPFASLKTFNNGKALLESLIAENNSIQCYF